MKEFLEEIKEIIEKNENNDYSKILNKSEKLEYVLALSPVRSNIINWYSFKENSSILELNGNYGEITGFLCQKANRVVTLEEDNRFAEIIEKRYKNEECLEVKNTSIYNENINEKFDYVIVIGITEKLEDYIKYAKDHLNENGVILLAINNKFGIKSFITCTNEYKLTNNDNLTITKNKLDKMLDNQELNYKYYYPLPDYKLTNVIFTENYMPDLENISRDITYKCGNVNFNEIQAYRELLKDNRDNFKFFANSFLVEISKKELEDNSIKFISYTNMRKEKYRIRTTIKNEYVEKTYVNEVSKKHIEIVKKNIDLLNKSEINTLDSYTQNEIISKFTTAQTYNKILLSTLKEEGIDKFIEKIIEFQDFLKQKLETVKEIEQNVFDKYEVEYEKEKIEKLTFVKNGLWDLTFQNCFYIDNNYYAYDQEWFEENIPVEFIIYRSILYFNEIKQIISDEEIFSKLNIDTYYLELFNKLDNILQTKIRKESMWKLHTKEESESKKYQKIKNENENLKQYVKILEEELANKTCEVQRVTNSLSWKVTKPLRAIRRLGRK